jgi:hypothetical protein
MRWCNLIELDSSERCQDGKMHHDITVYRRRRPLSLAFVLCSTIAVKMKWKLICQ